MKGQGLAPPPQTPPPLGRRDGSLHLLPRPFLPSRRSSAGRFHRERGPAASPASSLVLGSDAGTSGPANLSRSSPFDLGDDAPDTCLEKPAWCRALALLPMPGRPGAEIESQHALHLGSGSRPAVRADDTVTVPAATASVFGAIGPAAAVDRKAACSLDGWRCRRAGIAVSVVARGRRRHGWRIGLRVGCRGKTNPSSFDDPLSPFRFHQQPPSSGPCCRASATARPTPKLAGQAAAQGRRCSCLRTAFIRVSSEGRSLRREQTETKDVQPSHPRRPPRHGPRNP